MVGFFHYICNGYGYDLFWLNIQDLNKQAEYLNLYLGFAESKNKL